jgi:hypothetical protein
MISISIIIFILTSKFRFLIGIINSISLKLFHTEIKPSIIHNIKFQIDGIFTILGNVK